MFGSFKRGPVRRSVPSWKTWIHVDGFTLIELMVAIALVALLAAIVVPNLFRSQPTYERKNFIAQLNSIVRYGQQYAITSGKIQRVFVDIGNRVIELQAPMDKKNYQGDPEFKQVQEVYVKTHFAIPEHFDVKNFIIEGVDEIGKSTTRKTAAAWFFIVPEGLTQEVTINFFDTKDTMYDGKPRSIGLVLNPFTAQFKEYDTFQK